MNLDWLTKRDLRLVLGMLTLFISLFLFEKFYRSNKLKKSEETYAIFIGYNGGVGNSKPDFRFISSSGKVIEASIDFDGKLDFCDTVWIKYSISDPSIAEVIDTDYKKYMVNKKP